jgi:nucleoside-diphosphate-sugar epimerase
VSELPDHHGRRVFVTGANGFVGRALTARYHGLGAEVRGVDVAADPERGVVAGDVTDPSGWRTELADCDVVIHTAAVVTNNVDRALAWHVNVIGTQAVLEAAADAGVPRFVQVSTMGVTRFAQIETEAVARYLPDRALDERWPLMPVDNPYADTKIAAEHAVLAAHAAGAIAVTIVRPADVYGPGCRPWVLEPLAAIERGMFLLPANGKGLFTAIYVDDLVDGIVLAAGDAGIGQIVHLGGEHPVTTSEYFAHLYRMLGRTDPPRALPTPVAVTIAEAARLGYRVTRRHTELGRGVMEMLAKTRSVSNAKAHELLGWWPEVDLDEGMRRTEAWLRETGRLPPSSDE